MAERTHIVEFSESEIREILGTAVKQMVLLANEPSCHDEIETLGKVVEKCSSISKRTRKE